MDDETRAASDAPRVGGPPGAPSVPSGERRRATWWLARAGMVGGIAAAYGALAAMAGRFLFPAGPPPRGWMFVVRTRELPVGGSLVYRTPAGATVNVAHQTAGDESGDFIALSSTCPHLGCQVHWQPQHDRFFCPCHNGIFTPDGTGIGGPPGEAGQSLPRYPLKIEDGLLYIEVPTAELAMGPGEVIESPPGRPLGPPGPGHDPCLYACRLAGGSRRA